MNLTLFRLLRILELLFISLVIVRAIQFYNEYSFYGWGRVYQIKLFYSLGLYSLYHALIWAINPMLTEKFQYSYTTLLHVLWDIIKKSLGWADSE